jgi:hypothetical protein
MHYASLPRRCQHGKTSRTNGSAKAPIRNLAETNKRLSSKHNPNPTLGKHQKQTTAKKNYHNDVEGNPHLFNRPLWGHSPKPLFDPRRTEQNAELDGHGPLVNTQ